MVELVGDRGFVVLGGCEGAPIAIVYSSKVGLLVRVMRYEKMNICFHYIFRIAGRRQINVFFRAKM